MIVHRATPVNRNRPGGGGWVGAGGRVAAWAGVAGLAAVNRNRGPGGMRDQMLVQQGEGSLARGKPSKQYRWSTASMGTNG